jgi:hypothetical protein
MGSALNSRVRNVSVLLLTCALFLAFNSVAGASILAQWTFETSLPDATDSATIGSIAAETGTGTASGLHASASTDYSNPAGNGSAESFSSNTWAIGDYYQFQTSSTGFEDIMLSWSQASSNTGPRDFELQYNFDGGSTFSSAAPYMVLANASPNPTWSTSTAHSEFNLNFDLSAISGLDNQPLITFRLVDVSIVSANGSTVATGGTNRVGNFIISGTTISTDGAVPEASAILVWSMLCGSVLVGMKRSRDVV